MNARSRHQTPESDGSAYRHTSSLADAFQTRREFLSRFGMGMGALGLATLLGPELARAEEAADANESLVPLAPRAPHFPAKAKRILHIFAQGAPSHIDLWDPKPELLKQDGKALGDIEGVGFGSPFKFAPRGQCGTEVSELWKHLGEHMDDIALIRSMWTDIPDHVFSTFMMSTGQGRLVRPSMGSWLVYGLGSENQNLPGYIALSPGAPPFGTQNLRSGFLPGSYQGTHINTAQTSVEKLIENIRNYYISGDEQREQLDLLNKLNTRLSKERDLEARVQSFELAFKMQVEATDAFDISKEPEAMRTAYGADTQVGREMLVARRLLERGVRVVQVWHTGWDHHQNLETVLAKKVGEVDQPVAALLADLKQRGMLEDTLVVWGGEFGRMPRRQIPTADIKAETPPGRDHNAKGFSVWMAGGGIKGGIAYGKTDDLGYASVENKVHIHDLHATILNQMGLDHTKLTYRYNGRDFRLTDVFGNVVKGVVA